LIPKRFERSEAIERLERLEQLEPFELVAVQRLMLTSNPRIGEINLEDLVDNRFMRKLDESGFIERLYGAPSR